MSRSITNSTSIAATIGNGNHGSDARQNKKNRMSRGMIVNSVRSLATSNNNRNSDSNSMEIKHKSNKANSNLCTLRSKQRSNCVVKANSKNNVNRMALQTTHIEPTPSSSSSSSSSSSIFLLILLKSLFFISIVIAAITTCIFAVSDAITKGNSNSNNFTSTNYDSINNVFLRITLITISRIRRSVNNTLKTIGELVITKVTGLRAEERALVLKTTMAEEQSRVARMRRRVAAAIHRDDSESAEARTGKARCTPAAGRSAVCTFSLFTLGVASEAKASRLRSKYKNYNNMTDEELLQEHLERNKQMMGEFMRVTETEKAMQMRPMKEI